jgi:hypothetical protein
MGDGMRAALVLGCLTAIGLGGCADRPATVNDVVGVYRAEVPATTLSPARALALRLDAGNAAEMAVSVTGSSEPSIEKGTWRLDERGEIRVVLARDGFGPVSSDITFRWARRTLTAVGFDTLQWGPRGFALRRE